MAAAFLGIGAYMFKKGNVQMAEAAAPTTTAKENLIGNKENKIRFYGTPQEIFRQFATKEGYDGSLRMSYEELLNALTPYNYRKRKEFECYYA